jgi:hypothetical protein
MSSYSTDSPYGRSYYEDYLQRAILALYNGSTATPGSTPASPVASSTTSSDVSQTPLRLASGLSTGAKAGIGVGVSLGLLAIIAALVFCWLVLRTSAGESYRSRTKWRANETTRSTERGWWKRDT